VADNYTNFGFADTYFAVEFAFVGIVNYLSGAVDRDCFDTAYFVEVLVNNCIGKMLAHQARVLQHQWKY
tara:strand:+ start:1451 stop:1657 length:207 start_codon:yes stop_codon:yes gene_type:complete